MIMDQKSPSGPLNDVSTGLAPPPAYNSATAGPSTLVPQQHMCMSLYNSDRVRLIGCPEATIEAVRQILKAKWAKGIDEDRELQGAHELKLQGRPWETIGSNSIAARQLVSALLAILYEAGWEVVMSSEMVKKTPEHDSIFFRTASAPQPPVKFFVIACHQGDKLRFIDAPQELVAPVRQLLRGRIQHEEWMEGDKAYQWKLQGFPFIATGAGGIASRLLQVQLLNLLATFGWEFHASVDFSSAGSDATASDSWYMRKYA